MNLFKKILVLVLISIILIIAYWLISPLFLNNKVDESIESIKNLTSDQQKTELELLGTGMFIDGDNFHKTSGEVSILKLGEKYYIRFEDNFKTTNGPDLFVYFGKDNQYVKEAQVAALKGNIGAQNYEVPAEIDPLNYDEVWIWCRAFSVLFGKAKIVVK